MRIESRENENFVLGPTSPTYLHLLSPLHVWQAIDARKMGHFIKENKKVMDHFSQDLGNGTVIRVKVTEILTCRQAAVIPPCI